MSKQIQDAYIVAATRLPVAKKQRHVQERAAGRHAGPRHQIGRRPGAGHRSGADRRRDRRLRHAGSRAGHERRPHRPAAGRLPITVPGITINRFCSSGVQAVADAANQIRLGLADVMIAAGTESMSVMPQMMGNKMSMNPAIFRQ
jgi:acetyl-CoA acyltransferase